MIDSCSCGSKRSHLHAVGCTKLLEGSRLGKLSLEARLNPGTTFVHKSHTPYSEFKRFVNELGDEWAFTGETQDEHTVILKNGSEIRFLRIEEEPKSLA